MALFRDTVKDFEVNIDQLKLNGQSSDYVLSSNQKGLEIYFNNSGENQLIGLLEGVNNFDLNTNAIYVG
ncbi:MAG TPA: hypothetical protein DCF68_03180 [Cyanothece sp. UBA12306]|nr:hypothetical protein [Cyanothece sp. UBA12306]